MTRAMAFCTQQQGGQGTQSVTKPQSSKIKSFLETFRGSLVNTEKAWKMVIVVIACTSFVFLGPKVKKVRPSDAN